MIVDLRLVQRIEWSAARLGELQTAAVPGGTWEEIDGGALLAMGPKRYVNRAIGVGLGPTDPIELLDRTEAFYAEHAQPASLEVSPWVPQALVDALRSRGYSVDWFRNVYARELHDLPPLAHEFPIELVDTPRMDEWRGILGQSSALGTPERAISDEFCDAAHRVAGTVDLAAVVDGRAVACGSLSVVDAVGWLGGAATLVEHRGRGAQQALLVDRLHRAQRAGCDLAAVTALPGGASARNLTRVGFQLLHTQAVITRPIT